jgi:hypothetical protein
LVIRLEAYLESTLSNPTFLRYFINLLKMATSKSSSDRMPGYSDAELLGTVQTIPSRKNLELLYVLKALEYAEREARPNQKEIQTVFELIALQRLRLCSQQITGPADYWKSSRNYSKDRRTWNIAPNDPTFHTEDVMLTFHPIWDSDPSVKPREFDVFVETLDESEPKYHRDTTGLTPIVRLYNKWKVVKKIRVNYMIYAIAYCIFFKHWEATRESMRPTTLLFEFRNLNSKGVTGAHLGVHVKTLMFYLNVLKESRAKDIFNAQVDALMNGQPIPALTEEEEKRITGRMTNINMIVIGYPEVSIETERALQKKSGSLDIYPKSDVEQSELANIFKFYMHRKDDSAIDNLCVSGIGDTIWQNENYTHLLERLDICSNFLVGRSLERAFAKRRKENGYSSLDGGNVRSMNKYYHGTDLIVPTEVEHLALLGGDPLSDDVFMGLPAVSLGYVCSLPQLSMRTDFNLSPSSYLHAIHPSLTLCFAEPEFGTNALIGLRLVLEAKKPKRVLLNQICPLDMGCFVMPRMDGPDTIQINIQIPKCVREFTMVNLLNPRLFKALSWEDRLDRLVLLRRNLAKGLASPVHPRFIADLIAKSRPKEIFIDDDYVEGIARALIAGKLVWEPLPEGTSRLQAFYYRPEFHRTGSFTLGSDDNKAEAEQIRTGLIAMCDEICKCFGLPRYDGTGEIPSAKFNVYPPGYLLGTRSGKPQLRADLLESDFGLLGNFYSTRKLSHFMETFTTLITGRGYPMEYLSIAADDHARDPYCKRFQDWTKYIEHSQSLTPELQPRVTVRNAPFISTAMFHYFEPSMLSQMFPSFPRSQGHVAMVSPLLYGAFWGPIPKFAQSYLLGKGSPNATVDVNVHSDCLTEPLYEMFRAMLETVEEKSPLRLEIRTFEYKGSMREKVGAVFGQRDPTIEDYFGGVQKLLLSLHGKVRLASLSVKQFSSRIDAARTLQSVNTFIKPLIGKVPLLELEDGSIMAVAQRLCIHDTSLELLLSLSPGLVADLHFMSLPIRFFKPSHMPWRSLTFDGCLTKHQKSETNRADIQVPEGVWVNFVETHFTQSMLDTAFDYAEKTGSSWLKLEVAASASTPASVVGGTPAVETAVESKKGRNRSSATTPKARITLPRSLRRLQLVNVPENGIPEIDLAMNEFGAAIGIEMIRIAGRAQYSVEKIKSYLNRLAPRVLSLGKGVCPEMERVTFLGFTSIIHESEKTKFFDFAWYRTVDAILGEWQTMKHRMSIDDYYGGAEDE